MPFPHTFIKLTEEELKIVSRELNKYAVRGEYKKRRRLQVLWLSHHRHTFQQIAEQTSYTYRTVRELIYLYRRQGLTPFVS